LPLPVVILKPVKKLIVREKPLLDQKRYLVGLFKVVVGFIAAPYILTGEELPRMEFKADRLKGVGVKGHFHIEEFPAFGPTVYVEANLAVPEVIYWGFVGGITRPAPY
jgi:hypothetical protein